MKYIGIALLFLAVPVQAINCEDGCTPYKDVCTCDVAPLSGPSVQPSDEKPPSDKLPSYQREGVQIIEEPNLLYEDAKADQDKTDANTEGKRRAGIK